MTMFILKKLVSRFFFPLSLVIELLLLGVFLKKRRTKVQKIYEAQLLNYLKATEYKVGLLINFTHPKAEIKRFVV